MDKDPHVVIVGGGFGGLNTARGLGRAPVRVTLVDKRNYHLFRPLLYQVATGLLSGDEIAAPLRAIFSRQRNIEVVMSEVDHIDTQNRLIKLPQYNLHYDFLVLATGITYNYFGHDEWKQIAPGLESLDDADQIRGKILLPFETAERIPGNDSTIAYFRSSWRGDSGCGNGKCHGGDDEDGIGSGFPSYRSGVCSNNPVRSSYAHIAHLS
jgi:NADH dehydrogenase FAD-containing subunit